MNWRFIGGFWTWSTIEHCAALQQPWFSYSTLLLHAACHPQWPCMLILHTACHCITQHRKATMQRLWFSYSMLTLHVACYAQQPCMLILHAVCHPQRPCMLILHAACYSQRPCMLILHAACHSITQHHHHGLKHHGSKSRLLSVMDHIAASLLRTQGFLLL